MVLDFANEPDEIQKAFELYYETTLLSEETDPNLLYEVQGRLLDFGVFAAADIDTFARAYFAPKATQDRIYAALETARQRFAELVDEEGRDFLGQLTDYTRLYRLPLPSADLRRPRPREALPVREAPPPPAIHGPRGAAA